MDFRTAQDPSKGFLSGGTKPLCRERQALNEMLTSLFDRSVVALKTLHKNLRAGDPPIIVAAHTNHALDQLLRHIKQFDENFIRLGGFTSDYENIKPRTMYEVKQTIKKLDVPGGARSPALAEMRRLVKDMVQIISPLEARLDAGEAEPIKSEVLVQYGIITEAQRESLLQGARNWQRTEKPDAVPNDLVMWGGPDLVPFNRPTVLPLYDFEPEEVDLEFEQLKELEAEAKVDDDEEIDTLRGYTVRLGKSQAQEQKKLNDLEYNLRTLLLKAA